MPDDREKTLTFGLLGGRDEYEANQRRKVEAFLNHFRTQAELENFLFDMEAMRGAWKGLTGDVKRHDETIDEIVETQERRTWLAQSVTAFLKWAAVAGAGVAVVMQFWEFIKASVGDGS